MAVQQTTVIVKVGETRTGLWCTRCGLPSRVEVPIYIEGVVRPIHLKPVSLCTEHGRDGS